MTTKEQTCAQRIDEMMEAREEEIKALTSDPDADWSNDPALSIDRREIISICLSWGGPSDYVEIHLAGGEVEKVIYRFSDWFDTATVEVPEDSPLYDYAIFHLENLEA
jgi:hypothetical protein